VAQQIRGTAGQERAMQMAGTANTTIGMVAGAKPAWLTVEAILGWMDQVAADGVASRSLAVQLHRNAVVRRFDVVVSAAGAEAVLLGTAAQVRGEKPDDRGRLTVVADFGQLTTVGSVGVLTEGGLRLAAAREILIHEVRPWTGLAFADQTLFPGRPTERMPAGRYSTPEDVALTVLFLVSDESLMVNGQIIATDAGMSVLPAARANMASRGQ